MKAYIAAMFLALSVAGVASAQSIITTSFNTSDGFATGGTASTTLTSLDGFLTATFSGGQQQQMFDAPSYESPPAGYLFVSGPSFTGASGITISGTGDTGSVDFNIGVDAVSFFAADLANGTGVFRVLGVDDTTVLNTTSITNVANNAGAPPFSFTSAGLGAQIGSIEFDNAGPAGNPPYVIAIDTFSASVAAIPEPSSIALGLMALGGMFLRRRR